MKNNLTDSKPKETWKTTLVTLGMLPFVLVLVSVVFKDLWEWFIVPLGASEITHAHALGLIIFSSATRMGLSSLPKDRLVDYLAMLAGFLAAWGFGWLYNTAMVSWGL